FKLRTIDEFIEKGGFRGLIYPGDRQSFEKLFSNQQKVLSDVIPLRIFTSVGEIKWVQIKISEIENTSEQTQEYIAVIQEVHGRQSESLSDHSVSEIIEELSETTLVLTSKLGLEEMLKVLLKKMQYFIPYDFFEILILDENGYFNIQLNHPLISPLHNLLGKDPVDFPNIRRMYETKAPMVYSESTSVSSGVYNPGFEWLHAYIGYPIKIENQVVGFINAFSTEVNQFVSSHVSLIKLFSHQAAIAINKERTDKQYERSSAESDTLRESISAVASADSRRTVLTRILEQLRKVVPFDTASAGYLVRSGFEIVSVLGFENEDEIIGLTFPVIAENPSRDVLEKQEAVIISDTHKSLEQYPHFKEAPHNQIRSWLGIPVIYKDSFLGILALDSHTPNHFSESQINLASTFAEQVAVTLENARLFDAARRRALESETLHQVISAVASTLNLQEASLRILEQLNNLLPYTIASILMREDQDMVVTASRGDQNLEDIPGHRYSLLGNTPDATVVQTQKPVLISNIHKTDGFIFNQTEPSGVVSFILVPLILEGEVIGEIAVGSDQIDYFHEENTSMIFAFADQVVIAIKNAHLYNSLQSELQQRKQMEGELRRLASTDVLTGILNRRHFLELAHHEYERAVRYNRSFSIILIDIDHFKIVNDSYGHAGGDLALQKFSELCQKNIRNSDQMARYGGEEFIIMLPETNLSDSMNLAERLRSATNKLTVFFKDQEIKFSISLGVASLQGENIGLESLINRADDALYKAKEKRNQVAFWEHPG
ncbi:MAG: diguanylate cyclase, partial [Anaerolineaceae bacterium]|nr:diguanylate cyclase [Anaerolineaceae bacterium]